MKVNIRLGMLAAALALGSLATAAPSAEPAEPGHLLALEPAPVWIVSSGDNVCGVTEARQISNPAKVDYKSLLAATPEVKEMKRKGIEESTPEGQILYNKAVDRARSAASSVMTSKGHCSVWKKIRHRRGKAVADITDEVKKQL